MAGNKVDAESLELRELCRENLKFLKLLNQLTLPVTYSDSYYRRIMGASDAEEEPDGWAFFAVGPSPSFP
jgi:hypothetical protein